MPTGANTIDKLPPPPPPVAERDGDGDYQRGAPRSEWQALAAKEGMAIIAAGKILEGIVRETQHDRAVQQAGIMIVVRSFAEDIPDSRAA